MRELNFSTLRRRMLLGGIAPKYVSRTIKELRAHLEELMQAARNDGVSEQEAIRLAYSKLGEEDAIVEQALAKAELKSWSHRYTKSVYLLAPLVFYCGAMVTIAMLAFVGLPALLGINLNQPPPTWYVWFSQFVLFVIEYLFAPLLALLICFVAKQRNINAIWPIVGLLIVTFLGSGWDTVVEFPLTDRRGGIQLHWGYAFMPWRVVQSTWIVTAEQLLRIGVTIAMAIAVLKYYRPHQGAIE